MNSNYIGYPVISHRDKILVTTLRNKIESRRDDTYMKAKRYLYISVLVVLGLLQFSCQEKKKVNQKPNVLMICVDDLNDWIGVMGGHPNAKTPNMDKLAANGVFFTNAHCQAPICGPSRASIMTGLRPSTTGIYGQIQDADIKGASEILNQVDFLPEYFKKNGYHTMGKGKIFHHFAPDGVFDEADGREKGFGPYPTKKLKWHNGGTGTDWGAFPETDAEMPDYRTAKWAVEKLQADYDKPFLLTAGFLRPHVPWHVPKKWFDMHPIDGIEVPPYSKDDFNDIPAIGKEVHEMDSMPSTEWAIDSGEWKNIVQSYLASVTFVDHYIGEVLEALENSKYKYNTIVILWSDHGYRLGEKGRFAKHALWQEATNAPLIISVPHGIKAMKRFEAVELLDIYPTLIDLCGLPVNTMNEGKSLKPLIENTKIEREYFAITSYGRNNHSVVSDQFRYIQYEDKSEEFYDHKVDSNEWFNKAQDSIYLKWINKHRMQLPGINALWSKNTKKKGPNIYFIKQREEQMKK
jgi:iduronate 2-sulfatase